MSNEAQTINGLIVGGLASTFQAFFSVTTGIVIGFIYHSNMAYWCLPFLPFMMLGGIMMAKFH